MIRCNQNAAFGPLKSKIDHFLTEVDDERMLKLTSISEQLAQLDRLQKILSQVRKEQTGFEEAAPSSKVVIAGKAASEADEKFGPAKSLKVCTDKLAELYNKKNYQFKVNCDPKTKQITIAFTTDFKQLLVN